ncbi:hypothetical protein M5K25_008917 [Dendrobium thyrsiflorum]|uniref:DUF7887 domain-containing protein n=1 Tax=Dendrobium thyrsiflorum TaxID=117978 RepID=A0ABD0VGT8_DENTH
MRSLTLRFHFCHSLSSHFHLKRSNRHSTLIKAKKSKSSEDLKKEESNLHMRVSKAFLFRSAIAVFGLGFIDAGYSGDWSRIGVISKEAEELLKNAAYLVVPTCFLLIFFISDDKKSL